MVRDSMEKSFSEKHIVSKTQYMIILILTLFFSITTSTYAYFAFSASNNIIGGATATVDLTLDVTKIFPVSNSDNTGVMVPQLSVSGSLTSPLSTALKNGCVDSNKNIICQVYKINVQNIGGTAAEIVDGYVSFYGDSAMTTDVSTIMPSLRWKLITSVDTTTPANSVLGTNVDLVANNSENVFANDIIMVTNSSFDYYMIVWINETQEDQPIDSGKTFFGKIEFNSYNGKGVMSTFTA